MLGATAFGVVSALVVGSAYRRLGSGIDAVIATVWSVGMALGVLFVALAPGYAPDLTSYLFGSLLFVPWDYVALVGALDLLILAVVAASFRRFEAVCFDEEFAEVTGVRVERVFLGLLALAALAIVTLIRVVGILLAIALLTIPATIARQWSSTLRGMMAIATLVCAVCIASGLFLSYGLSTAFEISAPPGPLVILLAATLYGASSALRARGGSR
jgi:zinc transport system permease protein